MEQRRYFPEAQRKGRRAERIKKWFCETFRTHTKEEYKEFLTRGFDGSDRVNKVYPWAYMRMLVLCFLLFAVTTFFMYISNNAISYPTMVFLGALLINLPFMTLIYELCPKTDLSLVRLIFVLVVGGCASVIITELGYLAFSPENGYGAVAWTAVLEELAKIIPSVAAILIMKKRQSPMACFAIAAAVGVGMSVIEDMGYILFESFEEGVDLKTAITISVLRSVSGIATHTVWAAYVGWIFSRCKRPLLDVRFYAVCLTSMVLHFLWDLIAANGEVWAVLGIVFGFIFSICFTRWIIKKERRLVFEAELTAVPTENISAEVLTEAADAEIATSDAVNPPATNFAPDIAVYKGFPEDTAEVKIKKRDRYSNLANIFATIAAVIIGVLGLNVCIANIGYNNEVKTFSSAQVNEFISYVQDGYALSYDWDRPVDKSIPASKWASCTITDGKYTQITQIVDDRYYYSYIYNEGGQAVDGEAIPVGWQLYDISVKIDGRMCPCIKAVSNVAEEDNLFGSAETVYDVYCFVVRGDIVGVYRDSVFGTYNAVLGNVVFYGLAQAIGYALSAGTILMLGILLFAVFKAQSVKLTKEINQIKGEEVNAE